jgi:Mrp family chromosome partitioning ATPase
MSITENNRNRASKKNTDEASQVQDLQKSMSSIKHKFLVMSSRGGVGKTNVIVNLAMAFLKRGVKCGLMDLNYNSPEIHKLFGFDFEAAGKIDKPLMPMTYSDDLKVASIESVMKGRDETGVWGKPLKISDIRRFIFSVNWGELDYLFIDTPAGPGEKLLSVFQAIPDAKTIIVTSPNKISGDSAKKMINFFKKKQIPILGWIENMRGFLCQNCGVRQELFSTGPGNRAVFLLDIPFLGRIPIDPHMVKCADTGDLFLNKHPESEVAEACNLIIEKIIGNNKSSLSEDRSVYYDL